MKNWLKENWFGVGIILIGFAIVVPIFYYYAIFLPKKELLNIQQQRELSIQKEQRDLIEKYRMECSAAEDSNKKGLVEGLSKCTTQECQDFLIDESQDTLGWGFIKKCVENKIDAFESLYSPSSQ